MLKKSYKRFPKNFEIRPARNFEEFEETTRNASEVFGVEVDSLVVANTKCPGFSFSNTRVACVDGKIVASINVQRRKVNLLGTTVYAGCIAEVHTLPEYRQLGIGSFLLKDAINFMEKRGDAISMLFTMRHSYYGREGWRVIPRAKYYLESDIAGFPVPKRYFVKEMSLKATAKIFQQLYKNPSAEYEGCVVRDSEYWKIMPERSSTGNVICLVAFEGKLPVAACMLVVYEDCVQIYECINLLSHDEAPKNLLNEALKIAKNRKLPVLKTVLPETHPVAVKIMLLGGIKEADVELMMKVIDYKQIENIVSKNVNMTLTAKSSMKLNKEFISSDAFMKRLIGCSGFAERENANKSKQPLRAFGRKDFIYWNADKF